MTDRVSVQALRELSQQAPAGPWFLDGNFEITSSWEGIARWSYAEMDRADGAIENAGKTLNFIAACDPQTVLALLDVAEAAYVFLNAENNDPGIEGYYKELQEALGKVEL